MPNNTLKNFGQFSSVKQDKLNSFLESSGVEELDDAASVAVNGGIDSLFISTGQDVGLGANISAAIGAYSQQLGLLFGGSAPGSK